VELSAAIPAAVRWRATPILRGRFHDDLFDLALDESVGQRAQVSGVADLLAIELNVSRDLAVGH